MSIEESKSLVRRVYRRCAALLATQCARRSSVARVDRVGFQRILVLCYGNIYRSPFAKAYLERMLGYSGRVSVRSAGFHPRAGRSTPKEFVQYVRRETELDLSGHRSRMISHDDLEWADSIVIMDRHNWHALAAFGRKYLENVIWLGALRYSGKVEIPDPYGRPDSHRARIVEELMIATRTLEKHIRSRVYINGHQNSCHRGEDDGIAEI